MEVSPTRACSGLEGGREGAEAAGPVHVAGPAAHRPPPRSVLLLIPGRAGPTHERGRSPEEPLSRRDGWGSLLPRVLVGAGRCPCLGLVTPVGGWLYLVVVALICGPLAGFFVVVRVSLRS